MADILIADDVQTDLELLARTVASLGHRVHTANDGEEAVAKAKALHPALVLLDVVMPKVDGFNACRRLKRDPDTAAIPVVLVTQKAAESDRAWAKRQGADEHLAKPCTPDQVRAMVRRFVP